VDEIQDLRPVELRFLRALVGKSPERLALYGDAGQRLYAGGVTLSALGIDVRGRSHVLRLNYRTTEQIRRAADSILEAGAAVNDDLDGGKAPRTARSLHTGPAPAITGFDLADAERDGALQLVREWIDAGIEASAIGVFARANSRVSALDLQPSNWIDRPSHRDREIRRAGEAVARREQPLKPLRVSCAASFAASICRRSRNVAAAYRRAKKVIIRRCPNESDYPWRSDDRSP